MHIGIGGWSYPPWRGEFYPDDLPQKRELEYASSKLTSIEINSTFYGLQKPATFARWRDATPEHFVFALKAPRFVTHRHQLASAGDAIGRFLDSGVGELRARLGPINWQLAPGKSFDAVEMEAFLGLLPRKLGALTLHHAIEVRHASFADPRFIALARRHRVAIVVSGDSPYPRIDERTAAIVYARLMGTRPAPRAGYTATALDAWAAQVLEWRKARPARELFVYVIGGHKVRNPAAAMALLKRV